VFCRRTGDIERMRPAKISIAAATKENEQSQNGKQQQESL